MPFLVAGSALATGSDEGRIVGLNEIDPDRRWQLASLDIEGAGFLRAWLLEGGLATKPRAWWAFWGEPNSFVPAYFAQDLAQIGRSLEADGYYDAEVTSEIRVLREPIPPLEATPPVAVAPDAPAAPAAAAGAAPDRGSPGLVAVRILVDLGEPAVVCGLYVDFGSEELEQSDEAELRRRFPLQVGEVFAQSAYQETAAQIAGFFSERGHPYPEVERSARVDVPTRCVDVSFRSKPGAQAAFGETKVEGLGGLREELVTRELAYARGEPYDSRKVRDTERRLRGLRLFSIARLAEKPIDAAGEVPIEVEVAPGPENEVRFGAGYSSEEGVRGLASWSNFNLLGGGQQVGASARISQISRVLSASYAQPHFPGIGNKSSMTFSLGQDDESTYLDDYWRGVPQVTWRAGPELAGTVFVRSAYDSLSGVSDPTKDALGVFQDAGFTLSAGTSVRWTRVDDLLDPRRGYFVGLSAELAGGPALDADFSWLRLIGSFRGYYPIAGDLVGAVRVTLGTIPPYDGTPQIPLWERFYAGGSGIYPVRGYGRRRIGPITASNDPLGGRSLAIGAIEARYPLIGPVNGVAFVDVGDVQLSAWTIDPDDFQTGVGVGLRASSPVGPIEIDLGFGLDRPKGDSLVQFSFSIGPEF
jgi:outer membrane protein assembly complex protein YaeT